MKKAFLNDDAAEVQRLLRENPGLKAKLNEPVDGFGGQPILHVRSVAMLDVLLDAGADINARSSWWAGGFGLLDQAPPEVAMHAIERGATVTAHAAARLGLIDRLRELLRSDPALVNERGGDGQTPLHFASTVDIAEMLLNAGADIDARDIDHESTPAQYMVDSRTHVARFLIERGCATDILMAAAVGDVDLVRRLLDANPESIRMRVSDEWFPLTGRKNGGTIYQWKLGWYVSATQIAKARGFSDMVDRLLQRSPDDERLLNSCWLHDEAAVTALLAKHPGVMSSMPPSGRRHLAHACRNNDTAAAALMIKSGLPVDGLSQHQGTPLHWAAWHGNIELVRLILLRQPPLQQLDRDYQSTPLGWAMHGSENAGCKPEGDYPATVEALLDAGAELPSAASGTEAVKEVLRRRGLA